MDADDPAGPRPGPLSESEAAATARREAGSAGGAPAPEVCSLLRWAAAVTDARHVVEVGSGGGVTGLWLLEGMADRGVLTSIEPDAQRHGLATEAYDRAGVTGRVRAILGDPAEVVERLTDANYELCVLQADPTRERLAQAMRLLAPGGMIVIANLGAGADTDGVIGELTERDQLVSAVLPGDVAVATHLGGDATPGGASAPA